jgi:hypothetical protein
VKYLFGIAKIINKIENGRDFPFFSMKPQKNTAFIA